jgi:Family of unknown function (DUF5320)
MPGLDRTGPEGKGSRTGRAMGKCNPKRDDSPTQEELQARGRGMGRGFGKGMGRGFRNRFRNRGE